MSKIVLGMAVDSPYAARRAGEGDARHHLGRDRATLRRMWKVPAGGAAPAAHEGGHVVRPRLPDRCHQFVDVRGEPGPVLRPRRLRLVEPQRAFPAAAGAATVTSAPASAGAGASGSAKIHPESTESRSGLEMLSRYNTRLCVASCICPEGRSGAVREGNRRRGLRGGTVAKVRGLAVQRRPPVRRCRPRTGLARSRTARRPAAGDPHFPRWTHRGLVGRRRPAGLVGTGRCDPARGGHQRPDRPARDVHLVPGTWCLAPGNQPAPARITPRGTQPPRRPQTACWPGPSVPSVAG